MLLSVNNLFSKNYSPDYEKSFIDKRLDDPNAVYFTSTNFDVKANDENDDSQALQQAINSAAQKKAKFGIVFIPEGEYIIEHTIYVWKGIRLIGYGKNRPEFIVPQNTRDFPKDKSQYVIHFVDDMPKEGEAIQEANPGTFYSAFNNIDIEIQAGNPNAVAIKSHFAQHSFISNVKFNLQSGKACIEEVGNIVENCSFQGGEYGIIATKTSPSWPFMLRNSYFEGQNRAAISTEEAGLTIDRCHFKNLPTVISVNKNRLEELFVGNSIFENIDKAAVVISDEYNARSQYNIKNVYAKNVPVFARYRKSGKTIEPEDASYFVKDFCHGLQIAGPEFAEEIKTSYDIDGGQKLQKIKSPERQMPTSRSWVNIQSLGAVGDGKTDNTEIFKKAIEKHENIYLPTGRYLVSETILLDEKTSIIGLNPITTQIRLKDESEEFNKIGTPKAVIETPGEGENILSGIGIATGAKNLRAVAVKWQSGPKSMINDVKFLGGHGTYDPKGKYVPVYNKFRTGDPYLDREWDSQYWSLWVTNQGGGTFKNIWTANTYAKAGMYISNTKTPGRIYAISSEHHVRNEVIFRNVENWKVHALQMEEESAESEEDCLPISIEDSNNLSFRNTFLYRVIRMEKPFPYAIKTNGSSNLEFCGLHSYTPTKYNFNNMLYMQSEDIKIRPHEIARLTIPADKKHHRDGKKPNYMKKVVGGFEFIDGATANKNGDIFFVDSRLRRIYQWDWQSQTLDHVLDVPVKPRALAFDKSGNLIITTAEEDLVFSIHPDSNETSMKKLEIVKPAKHKGVVALLPAHRWRDEMHDFVKINTYSHDNPPNTKSSYNMAHRTDTNPMKEHFISLDGSTFIPNVNDLIRAFALKQAGPGEKFYMVDEFRQKTYSFIVNQDGSLSKPNLFAEKGEFDAKVGKNGNVYIPTGNLYIYKQNGDMIKKIEVPERPSCVIFGGENNGTLYITAGTSLYKIEAKQLKSIIQE